ncbi:uncharacterized protein LOC120073543 [Benincasa hispida]|uniref:uncharacterized protein LOC120073543 n=1 Tax=Benincasa hispida TaxID=102211 RepID=UPI0019026AD6|nr:uncharacterized protein LOC120073543 [Benincasa hispida]
MKNEKCGKFSLFTWHLLSFPPFFISTPFKVQSFCPLSIAGQSPVSVSCSTIHEGGSLSLSPFFLSFSLSLGTHTLSVTACSHYRATFLARLRSQSPPVPVLCNGKLEFKYGFLRQDLRIEGQIIVESRTDIQSLFGPRVNDDLYTTIGYPSMLHTNARSRVGCTNHVIERIERKEKRGTPGGCWNSLGRGVFDCLGDGGKATR